MSSPGVIVIGAGLVGLSLARELHCQGLRPLLLDAAPAGRGASWAGAGMLAGYELTHPLRALGIAAARLYPTWIAELEHETGSSTGYRRGGTLYLASPDRPAPAGLDGWERLDRAQVTDLEPGLRLNGAQPWRIPDDHSIDNRLLIAALLASLRLRGVELRENTAVRAVSVAPAGLAVLGDGWSLSAPLVVNAAGAWAASFPAPAPAPVRPRKGQLAALRSAAPLRAPLSHVIEAPGVYLVPRGSGRVLVGATLEDCGFEASVSAACATEFHARAAALVPSLAAATLEDTWIGFRPCSPDNLPLLGPTACPGYILATGHFRDGILLAPITAKIVAKALATGHWTRALDLAPFSPARFQP